MNKEDLSSIGSEKSDGALKGAEGTGGSPVARIKCKRHASGMPLAFYCVQRQDLNKEQRSFSRQATFLGVHIFATPAEAVFLEKNSKKKSFGQHFNEFTFLPLLKHREQGVAIL
ncbi:MAG: hypothetical protein IKG00_02735 [Lachnospiraceae bacterium]|nr:hypothetical protein [Lachnospiraceae bacterium]